jgi:hypothetical protein
MTGKAEIGKKSANFRLADTIRFLALQEPPEGLRQGWGRIADKPTGTHEAMMVFRWFGL